MIVRAEPGFLLLFGESGPSSMRKLDRSRYGIVRRAILGSPPEEGDAAYLRKIAHLLPWLESHGDQVLAEMERSEQITAPVNAYSVPNLVNLELTTRCPLRCPQCYCELDNGLDLPPETALGIVKEMGRLKIPRINLSGGETMVYPHLYELVAACRRNHISAAVALSGAYADRTALERLIACGVGEIYISLNGSTEEISAHTRDGHRLAVNALSLLQQLDFPNRAVNWVAHRSNIDDFPAMLALCRRYGVPRLAVLSFKPDSAHSLAGAPDRRQALFLAAKIREHQKSRLAPSVLVESCYSPMLAYTSQRFFGNINRGVCKGCGAGRDGISVDVRGRFTPCRHLEYPEAFPSIADYWRDSPILGRLRRVEDSLESPCRQCRFDPYCLSCLAVSAKLRGTLTRDFPECVLREPKKETITHG